MEFTDEGAGLRRVAMAVFPAGTASTACDSWAEMTAAADARKTTVDLSGSPVQSRTLMRTLVAGDSGKALCLFAEDAEGNSAAQVRTVSNSNLEVTFTPAGWLKAGDSLGLRSERRSFPQYTCGRRLTRFFVGSAISGGGTNCHGGTQIAQSGYTSNTGHCVGVGSDPNQPIDQRATYDVPADGDKFHGETLCGKAFDPGRPGRAFAGFAAATLKIDTTKPTAEKPKNPPRAGQTYTVTFADPAARSGSAGSLLRRVGMRVVGGADDATACDAWTKVNAVGGSKKTSELAQAAESRSLSWDVPAGATGKICLFAEDAAGNARSEAVEMSTEPDTEAPTVSEIEVTSSPPAGQNGHYRLGDAIAVTVTFDEDVVLTGSPTLTVKVGAADRTATCAAHSSEGARLACSYTVASGDADTDGVSVEANKLTLPSGAAIKDASDNVAELTHAALPADSGHKVDGAAPGVAFPAGAPQAGTATTITLTDAVARVKKYGAVAVAGTATDATGCDAASEIASGDLTTLETPAASVDFRYTPPADSAGRKVCVYAEDAAGNGGGSLWAAAIGAADTTAPTVTAGSTGYFSDRGSRRAALTETAQVRCGHLHEGDVLGGHGAREE